MQSIFKKNTEVSKMTLGTVQLGMSYGVNNTSGVPSLEQSFSILDEAYDGGVTVLDTSDDYGKSEEVIAEYLKKNPSKHFEICTKFNIKKEDDIDVYKTIRAFAERSMAKLGIDAIPIFMSHTEQNYIDYKDELVYALEKLKKEGLIKNCAMSLSNKEYLKDIVDCDGFDAVQIPMNILDNGPIQNGLIKKMEEKGMLVFVRSVYLQGLFFKSVEELKATDNSILSSAAPLVSRINEIASDLNITVAQLALSFIKDTTGVDSLVVGSETSQQVRQNVEMFNAPKLSNDVYDMILSEFDNVEPSIISPWLWNK